MTIRVGEHFLTLTQAANELGLERRTIWRWIKGGKLEAQKVGNAVLIEKCLIAELKRDLGLFVQDEDFLVKPDLLCKAGVIL